MFSEDKNAYSPIRHAKTSFLELRYFTSNFTIFSLGVYRVAQ